jgi:hypothetical protein
MPINTPLTLGHLQMKGQHEKAMRGGGNKGKDETPIETVSVTVHGELVEGYLRRKSTSSPSCVNTKALGRCTYMSIILSIFTFKAFYFVFYCLAYHIYISVSNFIFSFVFCVAFVILVCIV